MGPGGKHPQHHGGRRHLSPAGRGGGRARRRRANRVRRLRVAMGLIVLCFAEAGSRVSLTGGLYAYVEVAFGPLVGFLVGRHAVGGNHRRDRRGRRRSSPTRSARWSPHSRRGSARSVTLVVILVALAALNVRRRSRRESIQCRR